MLLRIPLQDSKSDIRNPLLRRGPLLPLRRAAATHNRPHVHNPVALRDVIPIESVSALVKVGAVNLQTIATFRSMLAVLPLRVSVLRSLGPHYQPWHPFHLVGLLHQNFVAVIGGDDVGMMLAVDRSHHRKGGLPVVVPFHIAVLSADDK